MKRVAACVALALGAAGCISPGVRFSPEIAASFAHQPMRHLETAELEIYYPEVAQDEAHRVAARLTHCLERLRGHAKSSTERPKLLLYLTSANFNNAYVQPMVGGMPQQMIVPLHETDETFNLTIEPGAEVADISCHEAVHYVQLQQVNGLWHVINQIGGDVLSTNVFTESWFLEGLAVHYEGRLDKDVGRPFNPIYRGAWAAGVAANHGKLDPGYLQADHRDASPFGGNYLVGERFVDYLADRFGEDKLWELVDVQASSWIPPLGVSLRFKSVYGESIGALFDDFSRQLQRDLRERPRPANQRVLQDGLGSFARIAAAPDGTLAIVSAPRDRPGELTIRNPDDTVRFTVPFAPILPERPYIESYPSSISGLAFSRDGARLYFVVTDLALDGDSESKLVELDTTTGDVLRTWRWLEGMGGDVTADGTGYVFTHFEKDTANLVRIGLASGKREALTFETAHQSLGTATISPSGKRIAFPKWMGVGFDLFVLEDGAIRQVTHDQHFNQSPRFVDEDHVVLVRDEAGFAQAEVVDLRDGGVRRVTDAPFVAMDPAPRAGGRLAFVNRDGWSWTLDEVALASDVPIEPPIARPPTTAAPEEPVVVERDELYRALDHLFVPTLHLPLVIIDPTAPTNGYAELAVAGSDRLGMHNYELIAGITFPDRATALGASYAYEGLAPAQIALSASRNADTDGTVDYVLDASIGRSFWTTPLSLDVTRILRTTPEYQETLTGIGVSTGFSAVDGSSYGGAQRGFALSVGVTGYPQALGNGFDLADVRGSLRIYLPPPVPRSSVSIFGVARDLAGAPPGLLRVGGQLPSAYGYASRASTGDGLPSLQLPTGVSFSESLRGYEDHEVHGSDAEIAGLDLHYPIVIDYGWASVLYVLPSLFVSQLDLGAFAREARVGDSPGLVHRDVGGSATLELRISQVVGISVYYQYAQRFDDGLGGLHLIGVGL